jgi:AraC-like DNA-binding protein
MKTERAMVLLFSFFVIAILFSFLSCSSHHKNGSFELPPSLTKAIDLFYLENNNEKALQELHKTGSVKPSREVVLLSQIIASMAVCETGKCDSATLLLQKVDTVAVAQNSYLLFWYNSAKGLILFRTNNLAQSYSALVQTINKGYDERAIGLNKRLLARICISKSDYKQGMEWMLQSSKHFTNAGLIKSVAINEKIIARYYMATNNYPAAFQHLKAAEAGLRLMPDTAETFYVYINYIDYYLTQHNFEKAKWYARLCLSQCVNSDDNQMKTLVYNNLGGIELEQHHAEAAIPFFQQTLNIIPNYNGALARHIMAHIYMSQALMQLNKSNEALQHAKEAVAIAAKSQQMQYTAYNNLAQRYKEVKADKLAFCYLDTAMQFQNKASKASSDVSKAYYETRAELERETTNMELLKQKHKKQNMLYFGVITVLLLLSIFWVVFIRLQRSRHDAYKELVKKNLAIIEEEKRSAAALQQQLAAKKISRIGTDSEKSEQLYTRFIHWLETEKNYTQSDISLDIIAKELHTNRDYLSRAINDKELRFTDLINKYRIQEAIRILSDRTDIRGRYTFSILAKEIGFNSDSTFIDAFKKQTGLNPAQFRKNLIDPS